MINWLVAAISLVAAGLAFLLTYKVVGKVL